MKLRMPLPFLARALRAGLALALAGVALAVHAQAEPDLRALALEWARDAAHAGAPAQAGALRLEVQVGAVDPRLKLAPCGQIEPYLPPGARLWGRSRVGLRCVDGMSRWNVTLPLMVRATGLAWVIKGQVAAGAVITEQDVVQSEVDWAEESSPVLPDAQAWLGQTATRLLQTGQAVRQGMLKPAQVFQAGAPVRVVAQGPGFQVSGDGQALSAGVVGQSARIRLDNGRVTSGTVLDARTVRIDI
jgi:flagellar basal body P-ring formation protein FlgA